MTKTLSVSAIKNGTVIDHIRAGQALRIIHLLNLLDGKSKVTLGLNLTSKRIKLKDLIKIENKILTKAEANEITVFAPEATINIVEDFEVTKKIKTELPDSITNVFKCPNPACITHDECSRNIFYIEPQGNQVKLKCHYCEKSYDRDKVKVKI